MLTAAGQFLAASGPGGFTISQYTKATKSWENVIGLAVPGAAIAWGPEAKTLVTVNGKDGVVTILG
jgi:pre-mRNA-processing factor 19